MGANLSISGEAQAGRVAGRAWLRPDLERLDRLHPPRRHHGHAAGDAGLLRYAIPALVMLPLLLRSGAAYRKAGWLKCAIMVCGSGAPFFLICSHAMTFAPAAHVGVMLPGVMPMFVALFAFLLFGERFGGARLLGYGMVLAGVSLWAAPACSRPALATGAAMLCCCCQRLPGPASRWPSSAPA